MRRLLLTVLVFIAADSQSFVTTRFAAKGPRPMYWSLFERAAFPPRQMTPADASAITSYDIFGLAQKLSLVVDEIVAR
jgi:hypothetical protein